MLKKKKIYTLWPYNYGLEKVDALMKIIGRIMSFIFSFSSFSNNKKRDNELCWEPFRVSNLGLIFNVLKQIIKKKNTYVAHNIRTEL